MATVANIKIQFRNGVGGAIFKFLILRKPPSSVDGI